MREPCPRPKQPNCDAGERREGYKPRMFDETYMKGYRESEQHPSEIRKDYVAHRTYCDRTGETDPHRRSYVSPISPVHGCGYERAQYDMNRMKNVENRMRSFVRKLDGDYDAHDDYPGKGSEGCEGSMPLEFVSNPFQ